MNHLADVIVWVIVAAAAVYAARALLPARVGQALRLRAKGDGGGCHGGGDSSPAVRQDQGAVCGGGCSGCSSARAPLKG